MTLTQVLAAYPQVHAFFEARGIDLSTADFLTLYSAIAPIAQGTTPPAPAAGPTIPTVLDFGGDANNAPYGVTLAGWSPQNHQGANLRDPQNAKYIVYAYLVANKIAPSSTWAPAAVALLQQLVPAVPWQAADGETLVYGDEYVHPAPNGHGMQPGTFNPDVSPTEFFWGSIS